MASWRDEILKDFPAGICKLTIVQDPDRLFEEAVLVQELNCRGYEIVKFGDPIVFRYEYEKSIDPYGMLENLLTLLLCLKSEKKR